MLKEDIPNYYSIIPANARYDNRLKANEKLLYAEITALANKTGYCFASNRYFSKLYDITTVSVSRWISHLEQLEYIKTEIIKSDNKQILERRIYLADTYYQKSIYPINKNDNTPINRNVKDNNINNNITRVNKSDKQFFEERKYSDEFLENLYANSKPISKEDIG